MQYLNNKSDDGFRITQINWNSTIQYIKTDSSIFKNMYTAILNNNVHNIVDKMHFNFFCKKIKYLFRAEAPESIDFSLSDIEILSLSENGIDDDTNSQLNIFHIIDEALLNDNVSANLEQFKRLIAATKINDIATLVTITQSLQQNIKHIIKLTNHCCDAIELYSSLYKTLNKEYHHILVANAKINKNYLKTNMPNSYQEYLEHFQHFDNLQNSYYYTNSLAAVGGILFSGVMYGCSYLLFENTDIVSDATLWI